MPGSDSHLADPLSPIISCQPLFRCLLVSLNGSAWNVGNKWGGLELSGWNHKATT